VSENTPSFLSRVGLAFATFFRVLFDGTFASQLLQLGEASSVTSLDPPPTQRSERHLLLEPLPVERDVSPALQLLELLQREGRLVDFVKQEIVSFSDSDVGAAARIIHQGCRKALDRVAVIDVVRHEPEGGTVTLASGFDAKAHRLVGNVAGHPPYRGTLKHRGWRVNSLSLEEPLPGATFNIIAPAEIEL
jgi:Domain of unknown function (DUF2760)